MLAAFIAFVYAAMDMFARLSERTGEELVKTIEAADRDLPLPIGANTRALATHMGDRGQLGLGTVLAALVVVIAVSLAVIVVDRFDASLGDPSSSSLSTAQNDVLSGFSDMTSLIGPLLLVAIAVVIIGLIRRVQQA
jgi:uncharacterized membrane-anchored protein